MRGSKLLPILLLPVVLGAFALLLDIGQLQSRVVFYVFQSRDLARALDLLHGRMLFYGPEMTGGGNLPGPFYYFILAACLLIQPVWQAAWYGMLVLAGLGAAAVFYFLRANALTIAALLWLPFFADSAHTQHLFAIFINPSFLFCFVMALLICAALIFGSENERTRERAFLAASIITPFAMQIHLSSSFIYLAILFMQWRAEKLQLPRRPRKTLLKGLVALTIPLLPYLVWHVLQRFGVEWGAPGPFTGEPESVWPTYAYLLKNLSGTSFKSIFQVSLKETLKVVPWTLPLVLLAAWFSEGVPRSRFLKPLLICAAFAFIPFSYVYFVPIANRYGMPLNLSLILVALIAQNTWMVSCRSLLIFNVAAALSLLALWT